MNTFKTTKNMSLELTHISEIVINIPNEIL